MRQKLLLLAIYALFTVNVWGQTQIETSPIWYIGNNVGIGTASPERLLDIKGSHSTTKFRVWYDDRVSEAHRFTTIDIWASEPSISYSTAGIGYNINKSPYYGVFDNINGASAIRFKHDGSINFHTLAAGGSTIEVSAPDMIISANGNVGIGTTSPNEKFEIKGGAIQFSYLGTIDSVSILKIAEGSIYDEFEIQGMFAGTGAANNSLKYRSYWADNILTIRGDGNIGIGVAIPTYKLTVDGNIGAREVIVTNDTWSDFVFESGYELMSLIELENYIKENKHLPEIPTTAEVEENGISVGEMNAKLLQKIEELTLYTIQQQEVIDNQREKNDTQQQIINELLNRVEKLENK